MIDMSEKRRDDDGILRVDTSDLRVSKVCQNQADSEQTSNQVIFSAVGRYEAERGEIRLGTLKIKQFSLGASYRECYSRRIVE